MPFTPEEQENKSEPAEQPPISALEVDNATQELMGMRDAYSPDDWKRVIHGSPEDTERQVEFRKRVIEKAGEYGVDLAALSPEQIRRYPEQVARYQELTPEGNALSMSGEVYDGKVETRATSGELLPENMLPEAIEQQFTAAETEIGTDEKRITQEADTQLEALDRVPVGEEAAPVKEGFMGRIQGLKDKIADLATSTREKVSSLGGSMKNKAILAAEAAAVAGTVYATKKAYDWYTAPKPEAPAAEGAGEAKESGKSFTERISEKIKGKLTDVAMEKMGLKEEESVEAKAEKPTSFFERIKNLFGNNELNEAAQEKMVQKQEVMEKAQEARGGMLYNLIHNGMVSGGMDFVPFVGGAKMMLESVFGETWADEKLTGTARLIHAAIGAFSFALDFTGIGEVAKAGVLVNKLLTSGKMLGGLEKVIVKLTEKGMMKNANMLGKLGGFLESHPKITQAALNRAQKWAAHKAESITSYKKGNREALAQAQ